MSHYPNENIALDFSEDREIDLDEALRKVREISDWIEAMESEEGRHVGLPQQDNQNIGFRVGVLREVESLRH